MTRTPDDASWPAFEAVLPAIAAFKRAFGRDISASFIAELYAARELGLQLAEGACNAGADAIDAMGKRYQIKFRDPSTLTVDLNNFDFDHLVLVNLDDDYVLSGMWSAPVEDVKALATFREKFRKYQVSQRHLKRRAVRIR